MDWLENWNQALDYLEENLDREIKLELTQKLLSSCWMAPFMLLE